LTTITYISNLPPNNARYVRPAIGAGKALNREERT
jgi:hypothetical protein